MFLRGLLSSSDSSNEVKNIEMRISFAEINYAHEPLNNELLYNALSHLACIPQLQIMLGRYENLRIYPNSEKLNIDICDYVESKIKEAKELVDEISRNY